MIGSVLPPRPLFSFSALPLLCRLVTSVATGLTPDPDPDLGGDPDRDNDIEILVTLTATLARTLTLTSS